MSVPIHFLTAVLKKSVIRATYRGGLERFVVDYPNHHEDEHLVAKPFMSGGELDEFADAPHAAGFDIANGWAVGEMSRGEWERCEGIAFVCTTPGKLFGEWEASWQP